MAQLDYYRNPDPNTNKWAPYFVDLQHEMLSDLKTRIMAPLVELPTNYSQALTRANPVVKIDGQNLLLSVTEMGAVSLTELGEPIGKLDVERETVLGAIDLLFTGI